MRRLGRYHDSLLASLMTKKWQTGRALQYFFGVLNQATRSLSNELRNCASIDFFLVSYEYLKDSITILIFVRCTLVNISKEFLRKAFPMFRHYSTTF